MKRSWLVIVGVLGCTSAPGNPVDASAPDTGTNGCEDSDFVEVTAITWTFQVSPRCVHVPLGGKVTWTGDFSMHPLAAFNGDTPNPITSNGATGSVTITFPNAGTYGFQCTNHSTMLGAVKVGP